MPDVTVLQGDPILLIDASYYIFYRYFATFRWYSFQHQSKNEPETFIQENEDHFNQSLFKHFDNDIVKLCKKWKTSATNILFCKDCSRADIWRMSIYPQYKQTRTPHKHFNADVFPALYQKFDLFQSLSIATLEADDVACLTHEALRGMGATNKIVFITNDNDYLQLKDDNNEIYNLEGKGKNIAERGLATPRLNLMNKIINGDKSDNIHPIKYPMTKDFSSKCLELSNDALLELTDEMQLTDKFLLNKQLIDMSCIPDAQRVAFADKYTFVVQTLNLKK